MTADFDLGRALARADATFSEGDSSGTDEAYRAVVRLARERVDLRDALAFDHVARLWTLDADTLALRRCTDYLSRPGTNGVELRMLRAEILSSMGRHADARADVTAVRAALDDDLTSLAADQRARLYRVDAFAAADEDVDGALRFLALARREYLSVSNMDGVARIDRDRRAIGVFHGSDADVAATLSEPPPDTVAGRLVLAMALRSQLRYEDALAVVRDILDDPGLDQGPRGQVLYEYFLLLRLTRQHDEAERLYPELREAASADPVLADEVARLSTEDSSASRLDHELEHARRLIVEKRWDEAEELLRDVRPRVGTDRDAATWHLVAGQLALETNADEQAVEHLDTALHHSVATSLAEVRVLALGARGDAAFRFDDYERAVAFWAEAYALEERTAGLQRTDEVRIGMLKLARTVHDRMIAAATAIMDRRGPEAVVVAMETTRGATLLDHLDGGARDLPSPVDHAACQRWVRELTDTLAPAQAIWVTHAAPDRIHHALVGRDLPGLVHVTSFPLERQQLTDAVNRHRGCWSNPQVLETSIANGEFDDSLVATAELIRVHDVLGSLPPHVRRIAVVPALELGDIPFAAIPVPDSPDRLVHRLALSDLPSLSVFRPLHQRSRRLRGNRSLRVRPSAVDRRRLGVLGGRHATVENLRSRLASHRYHRLRVDSHGWYHDAGSTDQSRLQLTPDGPAGQVDPAELAGMDLSGCGTALLGACESGMARYRGRVERTGFPRAAMAAGAASVVAARWVAHADTAEEVLDRFVRYARRLPRDVALQRAQRDLCDGARGTPSEPLFHRHPARWACWVLYGCADRQPHAVRRLLTLLGRTS